MKTNFLRLFCHLALFGSALPALAGRPTVIDSSPLHDKAAYFQRDLLDKHWLDGENWTELKLGRENETGTADYLHAYWMGRYYGMIKRKE